MRPHGPQSPEWGSRAHLCRPPGLQQPGTPPTHCTAPCTAMLPGRSCAPQQPQETAESHGSPRVGDALLLPPFHSRAELWRKAARSPSAHLHHEQSFTSKRSRSFSIVFLREETERNSGGRGAAGLGALSPLPPPARAARTRIPSPQPRPAPLGPPCTASPPRCRSASPRALTRCPRRTRRWRPGRPPRCVCCACGRHRAALSRAHSRAAAPPPPIPAAPALTGHPRTHRRAGGGASGAPSRRARS